MPRVAPVPRRRPLVPAVAIVVAALSLAALFASAGARTVSADTASSMEASLLAWINDARQARGRAQLVQTGTLADLAGDRAATMAAKRRLDHDAAGCLRCQLDARGVAWELYGEAIGWTSWPWGSEAAHSLFDGWHGSSFHWDLLMGSSFNTVGIGVAKASDGSTYASIVLVDAPGGAPKATPKPTPRPTPTPTPAPIIASTPGAPDPDPVAITTPEPTPTPVPDPTTKGSPGPNSPYAPLPL